MRIHDRISRAVLGLVPLLSLVFLAGCSSDLPVSPPGTDGVFSNGRSEPFSSAALPDANAAATARSRGLFPLAIGNRWHAVAEDRAILTPSDGGPPVEQFAVHTDITRELTGTETIDGRTYVLQREDQVSTSTADPNPSTYTTWIRYRQDANGLYEADVTGPPAAASSVRKGSTLLAGAPREFPPSLRSRVPAGKAAAYDRAWGSLQRKIAALRAVLADPARTAEVMPGEITRLEYPLHPGATWTIRSEPSFWCEVERLEHLDLAAGRFAAYRLRIENEFLDEGDRIHLWMGRAGQLQLVYQLVSIATDGNGNEVGRVTADHHEVVDQLSLVRP